MSTTGTPRTTVVAKGGPIVGMVITPTHTTNIDVDMPQDISRLTYAEWRMLMNDTPPMDGLMERLDGPEGCIFGGCDTVKTAYVTECDTAGMCIDTSFRLPPSLLDTINQGSSSPVNVNGVSLRLRGYCE